MTKAKPERLIDMSDLALTFLRLGTTAFGGPAAHIAMMRTEFVEKRKLVTEEEYIDLVGASSLLPGPSSTEVAIFLGYRLLGWFGLFLAGSCFILPAMLIVMVLASGYVSYGHLPASTAILYGIKPVIVAIIAQAVWSMAKSTLKSPATIFVTVVVIGLSLVGVLPLPLIFGGGLFCAGRHWLSMRNASGNGTNLRVMKSVGLIFALPLVFAAFRQIEPHHLTNTTLLLEFVKIGSMVFGSGYVLISFLRSELVNHLHWLTQSQLLDSISVGQFTPGPVFTTATFIGYLLKGPVGALLATLGIFLPAFFFVAIAGKTVRHIRSSVLSSEFLNGVNAAAIALICVAGYQIAQGALVDWTTALMSSISALILIKFKINSAWMVLAGGAAGLLVRQFGLVH